MTRNELWAEWIRSTVSRFETPLLLYAMRLLGDEQEAQDAVQETFTRLCAQDRAAVEGYLNVWLFSVCRNYALEVRRKKFRVRELGAARAELTEAPDGPVGGALEGQEDLAQVRRELSKLPARQQEVIRLKFEQGLSYREISAVTKLTITNVGFLIHVGLKRIRERLAETAGTPAPADVTSVTQ